MIKNKQTLASIRSYYSMALLLQGPITSPYIIISSSSNYYHYYNYLSPKYNPIHNFSNNLSVRACSSDPDRCFYYYNRAHLPNITTCFINSNYYNVKNDFVLNKPAAFCSGSGEADRLPNGCVGNSLDKIAVAVDIDEVLGNFVSALNRFVADRYSSNHSVSEYHVYEFFRIWNCTRDEADFRVHEFFKTPYFKKGIYPIPGALSALQKVSSFCNLSIVTSRQNAIKDHTIQWIENHYPGLFHEIHFGNHFALEGKSRPKSDICRSLGAKVLIDDNPRYAMECAEVGIRVLLFDYEKSYPWCKIESVDQHPLVTKVHSWQEVQHQLVNLVAGHQGQKNSPQSSLKG